MEAVYKVKASELDSFWIESIQKLFQDKNIVIKISADLDETEFLTLYPANEKHLLDNIASEPAMRFTGDELKMYVNKKQK